MHIDYQNTFFNPLSLRAAAKAYLEYLPDDVDVLLSTGSSGCAIASAMIVRSKRPLRHVYVRKPSDMRGHGTQLVGWCGDSIKFLKFAIVDDFISHGGTIRRLFRAVAHKDCNNGGVGGK